MSKEYVPKSLTLELNEYQAANLRWLLRIAMEGGEQYAAKKENTLVRAEGLNNGNWNEEILWELEQQMIECEFSILSNSSSTWPLQGCHGGKKKSEAEAEQLKAEAARLKIELDKANAKLVAAGITPN